MLHFVPLNNTKLRFLIKKTLKIATLVTFLVMLGFVGIRQLFLTQSVQNAVVYQFTQRLNKTLETAISFDQVHLELNGEIRITEVLVRDHKNDSLFYVEELALDLEEFKGVLQEKFHFSSIRLKNPLLKLVSYTGDDQNNLQIFLEKVKKNQKREKSKLHFKSDKISIAAGQFQQIHQADQETLHLNLVNGSLSDISLSKEKSHINFESLQVDWDVFKTPVRFSAALTIQNDSLTLDGLKAQLLNGSVSGKLGVVYAQNEKPHYSTALSFEGIQLGDFEKIRPYFEQKAFSGELTFNGSRTQSEGVLQLKHKNDLHLKVPFSLQNAEPLRVEVKQAQLESGKAALLRFLPSNFPQKSLLQFWDGNRISTRFNASYVEGKQISGKADLILGEGEIATQFQVESKSMGWELAQQFQVKRMASSQLFPNRTLRLDSAEIRLNAQLRAKKIESVTSEVEIPSFSLDHFQFKDAKLVFDKSNSQKVLKVSINDSKLNAEVDLINRKNTLEAHADLERINLSQLKLTPENEDVRLGLHVDVKQAKGKETLLAISEFTIWNSDEENNFSDFTFSAKTKNEMFSVEQSPSDAFAFDLKGDFSFKAMVPLIENALSEAFLIPITSSVEVKETDFFSFNLNLEEKLVKALYPALEFPSAIEMDGLFSGEKGSSKFNFSLPYLSYKGFVIEGMSMATSLSSDKFATEFKADQIGNDQFFAQAIRLNTFNKQNRVLGTIKAILGKGETENLNIDFGFDQSETQSQFNLTSVDFNLGASKWKKLQNSSPKISYTFADKQLDFSDFKFVAGEQAVTIDLEFKSKNDFDLAFSTSQLQLFDVLPESEKFDIEGQLTSAVQVVKKENQQGVILNSNIENLLINSVALGDFSTKMEGSPQLNTYRVNASLKKEESEKLVAAGTVYVPNNSPNLDIDLSLNDFDLSFLSRLGKDKLTNVTADVTADLNLWGSLEDIKLSGRGEIDNGGFYIPNTNVYYAFENATFLSFLDRKIEFNNAKFSENFSGSSGLLNGSMLHFNLSAWELDLTASSERILVFNKSKEEGSLFYGKGYLNGEAIFKGPTKGLTLSVQGSTSKGTTMIIPWEDDKGLSDTSFIDFLSKGEERVDEVTADISNEDESFRGFEMNFDLDVNPNALLEIVVDQSSGSTLSGRGSGNLLIESNLEGKFNIWGDFITYDGIYNFKNLGLIDKKFKVQQGGTIVWDGDPLEAQLNIDAIYQVPGGANPALLVDNPNFNRKIPTNVSIQLDGNLLRPDDPTFDITFPNATGILVSEINYRLADQQRRQLQAISLLSQGIFISEVSVSLQGVTNNLYEKASDVFSNILGSGEGKLNVGLNYLQGEKNAAIDLQTEDRIGLTLTTQLSDKILINGKIGVPVDGVEETVIVGDVQIDFILNDSGSLRAKVFNRENDFRYLGDEFGYTQGMGMSYQVDFNTFKELLQKITLKAEKTPSIFDIITDDSAIDYENKNL